MNKVLTVDAHPVDIYVGRRLRLRRTILGMSQEAIGKMVGVTFQQIQKYERGINRMGSSRLYSFSKALGVPISYFFEGFDDYSAQQSEEGLAAAEPATPAFVHDAANNRDVFEVMRAFSQIKSPAVRKRIIDLVKAMAAEDKDA